MFGTVFAGLALKAASFCGNELMKNLSSSELDALLFMKLARNLFVVGATVLVTVCTAVAQTTASEPIRSGTVIVPERPTAVDANVSSAVTARPDRPERPALPPEVLARVDRFKLDARAYLAQQDALKKQLQGASDQERAVVREKLRALREQWLEQARELRQEYKERSAELESKLRDHRELFDELRNSAAEQIRGARDDSRRPTD